MGLTPVSLFEGALRRVRLPGNILFLGFLGAGLWKMRDRWAAGLACIVVSLVFGVAFNGWYRVERRGLPFLLAFLAQWLVLVGLPLITDHPTVREASDSALGQCTWVFVLLGISSLMSWWWMLRPFDPFPRPRQAYLLRLAEGANLARGGVVSLTVLGLSAGFQALFYVPEFLGLLYSLGGGFVVPFRAMVGAVASLAAFGSAFYVGMDLVTPGQRRLFWALVVANCLVLGYGLYFFVIFPLLLLVATGLMVGSGRVPWVFLAVSLLAIGFLNPGKTEMRRRYWWSSEAASSVRPLSGIPGFYGEWLRVSWVLATGQEVEDKPMQGISFVERASAIGVTLYVLERLEEGYPTLSGVTYAQLPGMLVPRFFWADKPGPHSGQSLLNVHFGMQTEKGTTLTSVAWGLVPEAIGNFGPWGGAVFLGLIVGGVCGWLERVTAVRPLLSIGGVCSVLLFVIALNCYDVVSGVLVTSTLQSLLVVAVIMAPFCRYQAWRPSGEVEAPAA